MEMLSDRKETQKYFWSSLESIIVSISEDDETHYVQIVRVI